MRTASRLLAGQLPEERLIDGVIYPEAVHGKCASGNRLQNRFLIADLAVGDEDDVAAAPA
jgi:hypothetical protein